MRRQPGKSSAGSKACPPCAGWKPVFNPRRAAVKPGLSVAVRLTVWKEIDVMAEKKVRVAFLGFWHSHACTNEEIQFTGLGVYGTVKANPEVEVAVAWDYDVQRGKEGADSLGIPFEPDLEKVLSREDIDGVVVMCETTKHVEVCVRAAQHKKHIYVNKVLAPTIHEANQIVKAARENNIAMVTMLSRLYENWCKKIYEIIRSGDLGRLIMIRIWHAHGIATKYYPTDGMGYLPDGHGFLEKEDGAGGCYVDMCHPQYMAAYFMEGLPKTIYSRMSSVTGRGNIEDNAIALLDYENGPYVTLEEGWACGPVTTEIEVQGTDGTVLYRDDRSDRDFDYFAVRSGDDPKFRRISVEPAVFTPLEDWIARVRNGEIPEENMARALDLSRLNEAAYRSAQSHQPVALDTLEE